MADESTAAAGGAMWALVTVILVALVVAVLYFGGFFSQTKKHSIDINVNKPGMVLVSPLN
jgi:hypothetical protein